jgi:hypothetical protein
VRPIPIINERPFNTGGETSAAAAAQAGCFNDIYNLQWLEAGNRLLKSIKSTVLAVGFQLVNARDFPMA